MNSPDAHSEAVEEATVAVAVTVVAETTVAEIDEAALGKEDTRTVGCLETSTYFLLISVIGLLTLVAFSIDTSKRKSLYQPTISNCP